MSNQANEDENIDLTFENLKEELIFTRESITYYFILFYKPNRTRKTEKYRKLLSLVQYSYYLYYYKKLSIIIIFIQRYKFLYIIDLIYICSASLFFILCKLFFMYINYSIYKPNKCYNCIFLMLILFWNRF